jgi:chromosomal replication initiation ATPase DnaA
MAELNLQTKITSALNSVKESLKTSVTNEVFWREFITTLELGSVDGNNISLRAKNLFAKHVLTDDYSDKITALFNKYLDGKFNIIFVTADDIKDLKSTTTPPTNPINKPLNINTLNPNYTFANFIVSEFNKNAYNAAQGLFKNNF